MNHGQALSATPRERALQAILQFLTNEGLTQSVNQLEQEAHVTYVEDLEADTDRLLDSLMAYDEKRTAFKPSTQVQQEAIIDHAINQLKLSEDQAVTHSALSIEPHPLSNIISCAFQHKQPDQPEDQLIVASGGVDKRVVLTNLSTNQEIRSITLNAPILSLDFSVTKPHLMLAGQMNGQVCLIDSNNQSPITERWIVNSNHDHTKYVTSVAFSPNSLYYVSASTDGTVAVYKRPDVESATQSDEFAATSEPAWSLHHKFEYRSAVESVAWYSDNLLYVAPREDNYVHVIDMDLKRETTKYNLNASKDDHVSFSVMNMAFSPDRTLLALATDQHRLLVLASQSDIQVRNCYSLQNDGYSTPRLAWSKSGKLLYITQQNATVFVYDVSEGRQVTTLRGHEVNVRDIDTHHTQDALVSVSFDKTLKLWKTSQ